jgi:NADPH-dependent 2,4-dienoyl-CoA reductase/sulfur reductase-like enzyme/rhodanese-related sulfurtransferase
MATVRKIVIVGGVAGGASAAAKARRVSEDARIVLFERGSAISFANCGLPYYVGGAIPDRESLLVQTAEGMRRRFRIDVRLKHEVVRINRAEKTVSVRNLASGEEWNEPYDTLILSPGATPIRPPISGATDPDVHTLRSLDDTDAIKRAVDARAPERAVVVGGGYIGLEMVEALRQRGVEVTLVELADQVFIAADREMVTPLHQELRAHGVDLRLRTALTAIERTNGALAVRTSSGEAIACGMVLLAVGVRPETRLASEAGLSIGKSGGIVVDAHMRTHDANMRTSDPAILAIGDAVEVTHFVSGQPALLPLAGPANRQGRIAAQNALGGHAFYRHTQGTAICKVFGLAVGMTGLSERALKALGRVYEKVYVHPMSHAGYYPGAKPLSLKLLFNPRDGKVLGAQAVGADGIDKRIDVLATAVRAGMTVEDLTELELCYAPPYGSAKDPVNYAGFVASNVRAGEVALCHVEQIASPTERQIVLDVRTPGEVKAGAIPGARNIPVDDLRERLGELPKDKELLVYCQVGLRGYLACRILAQRGFECRNLSGGYRTYAAAMSQ